MSDDQNGIPLEVMTVALQNGAELVIHAMELRQKYHNAYRQKVKR